MEDGSEQIFPRSLSGARVQNLPSGLVPGRTTLVGRHIRLEPLDAARHAVGLYRASHGSKAALAIWDYLPWGPWPDIDSFAGALRGQAAALDRVSFALVPADRAGPCGMASYMDIHPLDGVVEIGGIWFAPDLQRTRAATEAMFLLLDHAMSELRYRRMQWRCNALNVKSRNAARRLGFRFEGIFHNHMIVKGKNRDTAWFSILDDEWPATRQAIAAWLSDENFDDSGQPRQSLSVRMAQRPVSQRG